MPTLEDRLTQELKSGRIEPIKLTADQIAALPRTPPNPFDMGGAIAPLFGIPIIRVATVEETTPHIENWDLTNCDGED